jgi:hypothetical protein
MLVSCFTPESGLAELVITPHPSGVTAGTPFTVPVFELKKATNAAPIVLSSTLSGHLCLPTRTSRRAMP